MDHGPVVALAMAQHGVVSIDQCISLGVSEDRIRRLVERGAWRRVRRRVVAVGAAPDTFEMRTMALCLAAGDDAMASGRTAARIWGLLPRSGRPELLVPGDRHVRIPGVTARRSSLIVPEDRTHRFAIPVTSPARTIIEVAPGQPTIVVGRWIDAALRAGVLDLEHLRLRAAQLDRPGRPRIGALRAALSLRTPGRQSGDSPLERWLLDIIDAYGLPVPVLQYPVALPDGTTARLDAAYPARMVALEADGFAFHQDRTAFDRDRIRQSQLMLLGWAVYRFTSAMPDPDVAAMVGAALGRPIEPAKPPAATIRSFTRAPRR
jgi:hypothetical protein